ncbi:DUF4352 domain-containing protein [Virgibacillus sp. LDC-1]|uniref:DUF4352 domain-containing protein n=1 Tax=Virgibacillus sp. LDC-1 TaxID=3039856 RepID=UPI0024DEDA67|nr:DUF4352 domain-containing protein [Virgibacillus sp. LDC-1]
MKKMVTLIVFMLFLAVSLIACNNEEKNTDDENKDNQEEKQQETEEKDDQNKSYEKEETKTSGKKNIKVEDQLDLKIGDTGTFDTTLGTYEMTVESAKLVGPEFEGIESRLDNFILVDLKIKNTSNETLQVEDLMMSMQVTEYLDGSGFTDSSKLFENLKTFSGSINPGEEMHGQFIAEIYESETYYFRENPGTVAGGGSNQVIWNMPAEEVK